MQKPVVDAYDVERGIYPMIKPKRLVSSMPPSLIPVPLDPIMCGKKCNFSSANNHLPTSENIFKDLIVDFLIRCEVKSSFNIKEIEKHLMIWSILPATAKSIAWSYEEEDGFNT